MKTLPRVVLFQPRTGVLSEIKTRPSFPLALLSAARRLGRDFEVVLVDQRVEPDWQGRLEEELRQEPLCVGVTSITGSPLRHALEAGRFVKLRSPRVPVVWGGVHATLLTENTLQEASVDVVVRGEGEETFADLVQSFLGGKPPDAVPGVSFRRDGRPVHNPARGHVRLDGLPFVPYHLARADYLFLRKGRPSMYLETSRGCPYRCAFCYNTAVGNRTWRAMGAQRVIASVEEILRVFPRVGHLSLVDDNYFVDLERVREICRQLIRKGFGLTYQVQGTNIQTVRKLSREDLSLLRRSGCERLDMGVESGSDRVLEAIDKGLRVEDVAEANRKLRDEGIEPWFNFMGGFPMETDQDLKSTVRLMSDILRENKRALLSPLYCYTPYPGNRLFEQARELGFEPPESLEKWADYGWDRARLPWITRRKARDLESYYFLSIFIDRKVFEYMSRWWLLVLALCYRPVAKLRFRHGLLGFMAEKWVYKKLMAKTMGRGG